MSTVDLDAIRKRVETWYVGVPPYLSVQDARDLVGEVERLRANSDSLAATIAAYLETDERGIHHAANTAHARAQRDEAHAETQEIAAELAEERTLHQRALAEVERLRDPLIYVNTDDGYPWLTCDRCDTPLHLIEAGDSLPGLLSAVNIHRCASTGGDSTDGKA